MAPSSTTTSPIPIVDFADFTPTSPLSTRQRIANDLVRACREVGFVYITNHSVPPEKLAAAFAASKHFYSLPLAEKMKAPHPPGWAVHRGYSWPGLEKVSNATSTSTSTNHNGDDDAEEEAKRHLITQMRTVQDFKESYEVGSEQDTDMPNIWPPSAVYPAWRPTMTDFYWLCFEAAKPILRALALGIGLPDEDALLKLHSGHHNQLRLLHYPAIPESMLSEGRRERMPSHTDWSTITLLFQDGVGGLQVEDPREGREGVFVDVPPLEGGMLLNVGDLLMRWSNDYLKSTAHRVGLPPVQEADDDADGDGERAEQEKERMTKPRYSIPYFLTTDPDLLIECLAVREGETAKYEPITRREYYAMRASMQY